MAFWEFREPLSFIGIVSVSHELLLSLKLSIIPNFPLRSRPMIFPYVPDDWDWSSTGLLNVCGRLNDLKQLNLVAPGDHCLGLV
jgi:hypothetical protein